MTSKEILLKAILILDEKQCKDFIKYLEDSKSVVKRPEKSEWIDVKEELPDVGEYVLTKCPKMGVNGETMIIVAKIMSEDDWYSFFPYDQPVKPTHWCYSVSLDNVNTSSVIVMGARAFDRVKNLLKKLTDGERMELFEDYCKYCGDINPGCQCRNDE